MDAPTAAKSGGRGQIALNVLLVSPEYESFTPSGGLGTHVRLLAHGLTKAGDTVWVLSLHEAREFTAEDRGTHLCFLTAGTAHGDVTSEAHRRLNERAVDLAPAIFALAGFRPDVVHCHGMQGIIAAERLARRFGCPLVGTVHILQQDVMATFGKRVPAAAHELERRLCQRPDYLFAVSRFVADSIGRYHGRRRDVQVVYNGAELTTEDIGHSERLGKLIRRRGVCPNAKIIAYAGRLVHHKGIFALLAAAEKVLNEVPEAVYALAGKAFNDAHRQLVTTKIQRSPMLRRSVHLLGELRRRNVRRLYSAADLVLVPSTTESFGYSALEAMLCGAPVIASSVGGLRELIEHDKSGYLVPLETSRVPFEPSVRRLAAAQIELLRDPARARRLGTTGRERAGFFTTERMVAGVRERYSTVLEGHRLARQQEPRGATGG